MRAMLSSVLARPIHASPCAILAHRVWACPLQQPSKFRPELHAMWGAAGPDHPAFTQGTSFLPPYDAYERFTVYEMDLPMANWFSSMPTALESAAHSTRFQLEMIASSARFYKKKYLHQRGLFERLKSEVAETMSLRKYDQTPLLIL